jgi:rhodanese-related sulfurtransferase
MAAGIRPNTEIARAAGIELNERGAIIVNDRMQTSDPDIYAGGDCVTVPNLVTGKPGFFPLGSMANRQGRVIGTNLAGGDARFPGGVGTWAVKLFEQNAAGAGLTIESALREGFDAVNVHVEGFDRAHFYPEHTVMALDLVVERPTRRVLGIQGTSSLGDALVARINAVAPLLQNKPKLEDISNLEVAYSPPFASAMDIINTVANVAENVLEGRNHTLDPDEFAVMWQNRESGSCTFVDTRLASNAESLVEKYPGQWLSIPLEEMEQRLDEIPEDKTVVLICNTGLRSFESQLIMNRHGRKSLSVQGGMASVTKQGNEI